MKIVRSGGGLREGGGAEGKINKLTRFKGRIKITKLCLISKVIFDFFIFKTNYFEPFLLRHFAFSTFWLVKGLKCRSRFQDF